MNCVTSGDIDVTGDTGLSINNWNGREIKTNKNSKKITVKPVYSNHPLDPDFVTVVDWWSLFKGTFMLQIKIGTMYKEVFAVGM